MAEHDPLPTGVGAMLRQIQASGVGTHRADAQPEAAIVAPRRAETGPRRLRSGRGRLRHRYRSRLHNQGSTRSFNGKAHSPSFPLRARCSMPYRKSLAEYSL